jgi:hypothetical protein
MSRIEHEDSSTTYEVGTRTFRVPALVPLEGPPEPSGAPLTPEQAERREKRRILQVQASTLPEDGNIGPSAERFKPDHRALRNFRRCLVADCLGGAIRNLVKLREIDDDLELAGLEAALAAWEVHLGG